MNLIRQGRQIRLPDFLIVGAARSGTTSVYSLLDRQPGVFMPREKEPMFFAVLGQGWSNIDVRTGAKAAYIVDEPSDYLELFRDAKEGQLIGEASTWYLYRYRETIRNLRAFYGERAADLRIIIILRQPAERAWSQYLMKRRDGEENRPFEEAIRPEVVRERLDGHLAFGFDYLGFGRYLHQVGAYLEAFSKVKILLFEDIVAESAGAFRDICAFLGVNNPRLGDQAALNVSGRPANRLAAAAGNFLFRPGQLKSFFKPLAPYKARAALKRRLSSKIFRPEPMDEALKRRVTDVYLEEIPRLAALIKRDLTGWLPRTPEETA